MPSVELGLGLLSIGRQWDVNDVLPPKEEAALSLIEAAYSNGLRLFDTAPAYARSEAILGRAPVPSSEITIATKMAPCRGGRGGSALRPKYRALRAIAGSFRSTGRVVD
ncbi:hypothetical protein G6L84_14145 [Agrobacterium tumefaciens]|nr:hypothetical protein [Agrobacterium tumefaciens]